MGLRCEAGLLHGPADNLGEERIGAMGVLPLRSLRDPAAVAGRAMREAREEAGLDIVDGASRLNYILGSSIVSPSLLSIWESGREQPPASVLIVAVRLAGAGAARIFASLA